MCKYASSAGEVKTTAGAYEDVNNLLPFPSLYPISRRVAAEIRFAGLSKFRTTEIVLNIGRVRYGEFTY